MKQYTLMDELHTQLKTMNRQFDFYTKHKTAMNNNLIALIDQTYPGANTYFGSPAREDGSQKWVDFLDTYWHVDCVRKMSLQAFTDHYQKWCNRKKYSFRKSKAEEIYGIAKELIPVLPKDNFTKCIIKQAVAQVNATSQTVEQLRSLMNETASKHGSPVPRKTLFQIMNILIKTKPDDVVYLFMDKKRAEGKP